MANSNPEQMGYTTIVLKIPSYVLEVLQDKKHDKGSSIYHELGRAVATALARDMRTAYILRAEHIVNCPECGGETKFIRNKDNTGLFRRQCKSCSFIWDSQYVHGYAPETPPSTGLQSDQGGG